VETGHVAVMSLGKEFHGLETSQPTNQPPFFVRFESPSKRQGPFKKCIPLFFWLRMEKVSLDFVDLHLESGHLEQVQEIDPYFPSFLPAGYLGVGKPRC